MLLKRLNEMMHVKGSTQGWAAGEDLMMTTMMMVKVVSYYFM